MYVYSQCMPTSLSSWISGKGGSKVEGGGEDIKRSETGLYAYVDLEQVFSLCVLTRAKAVFFCYYFERLLRKSAL